MRRVLAIFGFLLLSFPAIAGAQSEAEKLQYSVTWGYSDVAAMTVQRGCPKATYTAHMLKAKSIGVAEQLHEFAIRLDSFAAGSGQSLEGRTWVKEDGKARSYRTRFSPEGLASVQQKYRQVDKTIRVKLRGGTHDLLSWWFALRDKDLKKGAQFTFYVWDGWKLVRLLAKVSKSERLWTPAGAFSSFRIELNRTRLHHRGDKAYKPREDSEDIGTLWLSKDVLHTPVGMDFNAPVGVAKIRLTRAHRVACKS